MDDKSKVCRRCAAELPIAEFYRHPMMADGRLNFCRECVKARVKKHYRATHEQQRAYEASRRDARRLYRRARCKIFRQRHPEKAHAHAVVNREVRAGRLARQPCAACGADRAEAHHEDYSKPLDVMWLCRFHHRAQHGTNVLTERAA